VSTVEEKPAEEKPKRSPDAFVQSVRAHRLGKLDALRERGVNPYPIRYDRDRGIGELRSEFGGLGPDKRTDEKVSIAGRVLLLRRHGGLIFITLHDHSGTIQILVSRSIVGEDMHNDVRQLDLGDWVGVKGTIMTTRTGELSVEATSVELLAKSLRALPKHGKLTDTDTRYRQRYLDLIVNEEPRRVFRIRSAVIASIRRSLHERGFVEVEGPVLDTAATGAAGKPFITHHNALDLDMVMRIALELPLKRLIVGGFEKVYEIGRVFRNEGLSPRHNPEFTLLEAYQALADYHDMMDLTEHLISEAALAATGSTVIEIEGRKVDLAKGWRRVKMADLIKENAGVEMHPSMPLEEAKAIAEKFGIEVQPSWGSGAIMAEVFEETSEAKLIEPTFVIDYPREISPLARTHRDDPTMTERFELYVAGRELANAYSELNDPVDQRERFEAQMRAKAQGDEEAGDIDEDYVRALEYGMPPTGGLGIGIDRLVMLIAGVNTIREVILFPTMRPEDGDTRVLQLRRLGSAAGRLPSPQAMAGAAATQAAAAAPEAGEAEDGEEAEGAAPQAKLAARALQMLPRPRAVKWLAWLTALGSLLTVLPLLPVFSEFGLVGESDLPRTLKVAASVWAVLIGLGLLLIARQLYRRKRSAWWAAVILFGLATVLHMIAGPDVIAAVLSLAMVIALVWCRDAFTAKADPSSLLRLVYFIPIYLVCVFIYGVAVLYIERGRLTPDVSFGGALETVALGLVGVDGEYTYRGAFFSDFFPTSLLALGILGLLIAAFLLFRPLAQTKRHSPEDKERARQLVHKWGWDTLSAFALRDDKSYYFTSDGEGMVAYAYVAGYALVGADPICPPDKTGAVIDEFLAFCRSRAWKVAFLAAREHDAPLYQQRGFVSVYLGDEAIIPCDRFSLNGPEMKATRHAYNRLKKDHRVELLREVDASPTLLEQLEEISEHWRGEEEERGFTMAMSEEVEGKNEEFLLAIARGPDDKPVAFLRLVPVYGPEPGYSLDIMRRDNNAPNGINEFIIAGTALQLGAQGFKRLSMNFAAWGRLFHSEGRLRPSERLLRFFANRLNPYFQIRSLYEFNAKFAPDWYPRAIMIDDRASAPRVGVLYASVEGFLKIPLIGRYFLPHARDTQG
jgi:lysyl-tRNA synthetase class 2